MIDKPQTLTEKVIKGSSTVLLFTFLGTPIGYLIRVLYSNSLSIEMFGLFYAALAFFTLLATYLDLGLGYSMAYFIPKFNKKNDQKSIANIFQYYQLIQISLTLLTSLIIFLNAHFLVNEYFKSEFSLKIIYIFCFYLVANSFFSALNMLFIGLQKEILYSSMQFIRLFLIFFFSVLLWFFHFSNLYLYAFAWTASNLIVVIFFYFIALKKYSFVLHGFTWNSSLMKSMASYGLPTLFTASLYIFITSIDSIFLTFFRGVREVGIYNIIYPLATLSGLVLSPVNTMVLPLVSHLMEDEDHKISMFIHSILRLVPFMTLYFGLFMALFPSSIVGTLFGRKWVGLVELPLIVFSIGYVFAPLSNLLITVLSGMGKVKERLRISTIIVVFSLVVNLIFIPTFGVLGAAIANTLVYLLSVVLFTRSISKTFVLNYSYNFYLKLAIFSLIIFVGVRYLGIAPVGWIQIGLSGIIYTAVFILFGYTQNVIDEKMKANLTDWLISKVTRVKQK